MAEKRRYVVGIDLGTTNSALAFIDTDQVPRVLESYAIPQLIAPGHVHVQPTLPSFHHVVGEHELPEGATKLPWNPAGDNPRYIVGELARKQAQLVPGRSVASAKSWLCHSRVDRLAEILPWGGMPDVQRLSPVDVSARYLQHMAFAFQHTNGVPLSETEVVLTVPASFDEVARELTVEAAKRAGLDTHLTLLEEPQAAFYSWLADHARYAEEVESGDQIFVCDIGGGTTDFTLIEVAKRGSASKIAFQRTAVGDHLLLGGDNMDLALARFLERKVAGPKGTLPPHTFQSLCAVCRSAKEVLLSESPPESYTIHVAGRGAKLIGGGIQGDLNRTDVEEVLISGFFPKIPLSAEPAKSRTGLHELGLPYVPDPAVTRYMATFLRQHKARPSAVLFNGGVLRAVALRTRILDVLEEFFGHRPKVLTNDAPDLAVARGAAYYALTRRGEGMRISGGAARAYYVEVDSGKGAAALLCLTPRGLEEGTEVELPSPLELLTNRPVRFRVFSSAQREGNQPGDVLHLDPSELSELPPLYTVLRYPRSSQERPIQVTLLARLTEIGTLELWAAAREAEEALKWRLHFDLRVVENTELKTSEASLPTGSDEEVAQAGLLAVATEEICAVFRRDASPTALPRILQGLLGSKESWPPTTLRGLWEPLKAVQQERTRSASHEARWLNLAGFCLRPGFGYPLDDWRVKEAWRIWNAGLRHERDDSCRLEWWILWRRISGGLSKNQQEELWKRAAPLIVPAWRKPDKKLPGPQEAAEIWRTIASCERLDAKKKIELGDVLLPQIERRAVDSSVWALGRLAGRVPLYGSIDHLVPRVIVESWLNRLLTVPLPMEEGPRTEIVQTVAEMARLSGDRVRDISLPLRKKVASYLKNAIPGVRGDHLAQVVTEVVPREEREERFAFGDTLPVGLRLLVLNT